jgi:hypothetical protein
MVYLLEYLYYLYLLFSIKQFKHSIAFKQIHKIKLTATILNVPSIAANIKYKTPTATTFCNVGPNLGLKHKIKKSIKERE